MTRDTDEKLVSSEVELLAVFEDADNVPSQPSRSVVVNPPSKSARDLCQINRSPHDSLIPLR